MEWTTARTDLRARRTAPRGVASAETSEDTTRTLRNFTILKSVATTCCRASRKEGASARPSRLKYTAK
eukprot:31454-Pelagococcus_subviridis.AAC.6